MTETVRRAKHRADTGRVRAHRPLLEVCCVGLVVFGYFAWSTWYSKSPRIFSDEAGTLGNARWFAGGQVWPMSPNSSSSNITYPLIISPIFRVVTDPALTYRLVILANAAMVAILAVVLYRLCRRLSFRHRISLAAAACAVAYPAVTAAAGSAMVEGAATLMFSVFALTGVSFIQRQTWTRALCHAAAAGALSGMHGRFAVIAPLAIVLFVVTAAVVRGARVASASAAVLTYVVWRVLRYVETAMISERWGRDGHGDPTLTAVLKVISPGTELRSIGGQGWYLIAASAGLAVTGVWILWTRLRRTMTVLVVRHFGRRGWVPKLLPDLASGYLLVAIASIFMISVTYMAAFLSQSADTAMARTDHLYYGRYNESFLPILIALGVAGLLMRLRRDRAILVTAIGAMVGVGLLGLTYLTYGDLPFKPPLSRHMLSGLMPILDPDGNNKAAAPDFMLPAVWYSLGLTALVLVSARWFRPAVVALLLGTFLYIGAENSSSFEQASGEMTNRISTFAELRADLPKTVAFDPTNVPVPGRFGAPFWLPSAAFVEFDSKDAAWPEVDLFMGPADWPDAVERGLTRIAVDGSTGFFARA